MKKTLIFLICLFVINVASLRAEELEDSDLLEDLDLELDEHMVYQFPEIKPEAAFEFGARLVNLTGDDKVYEYELLDDSPWLRGEIRTFNYPHRQYLEIDFANQDDYFSDLRYSYSDLVLFRWVDSTLYHNLDTINLAAMTSSTTDFRDQGADFGVNSAINHFALRLKTPDFPFHVYFDGNHVSRKGSIQQRSLLGGAYYNNLILAGQSRDVDQTTEIYTIGTNSHLGPVEVDISHIEKRFKADDDMVLSDTYANTGFGPPVRTAGTYLHNQTPKQEGSTNKVKVHTSHTGKWVAAASFSQKSRNNQTSGAKADLLVGTGSIQWLPMTTLSFNLKYSHQDQDVENPASVSATNLTTGTTYTYTVKPSVSSKINSVSLSTKYKPLTALTLRAVYGFTEIDRNNAEQWNLQEYSRKNIATLTADARLTKKLTAKAKYSYKTNDSPSENNEPDYAHEAETSLSWLPCSRASLLLNYMIIRQERDQLHYADTNAARDRNVDLDNILATGTFQLRANLAMTLSSSFMRYKVKQDIEHHDNAGNPMIDSGVIYEDLARIYNASLQYQPLKNLHLSAEVTRAEGSGGFDPLSVNLLLPDSAAAYSETETVEMVYRLTGEYLFANDLSLGLEYMYSNFDDVIDNPFDSENDGRGHLAIIRASKKW